MAAPLAAAGVLAAAGLFQSLMEQRAGREAAERQAKLDREAEERARLERAKMNQVEIAQRMGQNEQGALGQLLGVLARTQR
jgi:hypothetical protein